MFKVTSDSPSGRRSVRLVEGVLGRPRARRPPARGAGPARAGPPAGGDVGSSTICKGKTRVATEWFFIILGPPWLWIGLAMAQIIAMATATVSNNCSHSHSHSNQSQLSSFDWTLSVGLVYGEERNHIHINFSEKCFVLVSSLRDF